MKTKCTFIDEDGVHCGMSMESPEGCDEDGCCELIDDEFPETICSVFEIAEENDDDKDTLEDISVDEYVPDEDDMQAFNQYGEFENEGLLKQAEEAS
jgi:hypothetical protein